MMFSVCVVFLDDTFPPNRDRWRLDLGQQQRGQVVRSDEDREKELEQFGRDLLRGHWEAQDAFRNGPALGRAEALHHGVQSRSRRPGKDFGTVGAHAWPLFDLKELTDPVQTWKKLPKKTRWKIYCGAHFKTCVFSNTTLGFSATTRRRVRKSCCFPLVYCVSRPNIDEEQLVKSWRVESGCCFFLKKKLFSRFKASIFGFFFRCRSGVRYVEADSLRRPPADFLRC